MWLRLLPYYLLSSLEYNTFLLSSAKTTNFALYTSYYFYYGCHTTVAFGRQIGYTRLIIISLRLAIFRRWIIIYIVSVTTQADLVRANIYLIQFCPNLLQDILVYNSFLTAIRVNSGVLSYTCIQDNFILSLVYPNDEKPTDNSFLSVTTSAKRILNVVFLVPPFGYGKQTPLIILKRHT